MVEFNDFVNCLSLVFMFLFSCFVCVFNSRVTMRGDFNIGLVLFYLCHELQDLMDNYLEYSLGICYSVS